MSRAVRRGFDFSLNNSFVRTKKAVFYLRVNRMKRKNIILFLAIFIIGAYLFIKAADALNRELVGEVTVVSGENTFIPFKQAVCGQDGTRLWDGVPLLSIDYEKYIIEVPVVHYDDNFEFVLTGGMPAQGDYTLYIGAGLGQIHYRQSPTFRLPPRPGEYLLCYWLTWGNVGGRYASYQYYVRLVYKVEGDSTLRDVDTLGMASGGGLIESQGSAQVNDPFPIGSIPGLEDRSNQDKGSGVSLELITPDDEVVELHQSP